MAQRYSPPPAHDSLSQTAGVSHYHRAVVAMAEGLRARGIRRLLIVGGTPTCHAQLQRLLAGQPLAVRYVDGAARVHRGHDARPRLAWAQLVVIWGSTPLPHKHSVHYTAARSPQAPVITVTRRSIAALAEAVLRHTAR